MRWEAYLPINILPKSRITVKSHESVLGVKTKKLGSFEFLGEVTLNQYLSATKDRGTTGCRFRAQGPIPIPNLVSPVLRVTRDACDLTIEFASSTSDSDINLTVNEAIDKMRKSQDNLDKLGPHSRVIVETIMGIVTQIPEMDVVLVVGLFTVIPTDPRHRFIPLQRLHSKPYCLPSNLLFSASRIKRGPTKNSVNSHWE